ncbi:MAG: hypothetical protein L3J67_13990 [Hyphomicrobiaceae bacterium]|nr:hypothetical protein [Hyphomicrobiaceae bacterium]
MGKDFVAHERVFEGQIGAVPPSKVLGKSGACVSKAFAHRSSTDTRAFPNRHTLS